MSPAPHQVLTIGHSTHLVAKLIELLERHAITALADVRSAPHSGFNPQFNREALEKSLRERKVRYVFLGRELGGRSDDPACYENGRVRYERMAQAESFRSGIERVIRGAEKQRIALLCAEKEPLDCHRALLVAPALVAAGIDVAHILSDGRLEPHGATMERLLNLTGLPRDDLFRSKSELIAEALVRRAARVAYVDEDLGDAQSTRTR